ncbi:plant basic secretory protein [Serendipita vermifera]|nr:plant basic secretory protein [Serendipita vermifera]
MPPRPPQEPEKPPIPWNIPKMWLKVEDMASEGSLRVFKALGVNPVAFLHECVVTIYELLYTRESAPKNVRSITFTFRAMDGIAYTTGSRLDNDHKEIHLSTDYFGHVDESRVSHEIKGVLLHEMVHCFQNDGCGSCPGGLVEGIADYVRLSHGLAPPHWKRSPGERWDSGYERTAYFLEWVNGKYGKGCTRKLNESMTEKYEEEIWSTLTGHSIQHLWKKYQEEFKHE